MDGKALRVRQTLIFEDRHGRELFKIQERMLRIKDSMEIEDAGGQRAAMVKKALITPLRERWVVNVADGPDLEVQGNLLDHEYTIGEGRDKIAEVSKKWFRIADTYGVEVEQGQNDALILAVTVALDQMAHPGRRDTCPGRYFPQCALDETLSPCAPVAPQAARSGIRNVSRCSRTNSSKVFGRRPPSCTIVSVTSRRCDEVRSVCHSFDRWSTACWL